MRPQGIRGRADDLADPLLDERRGAAEELEQDAADGVEIGPVVDPAGAAAYRANAAAFTAQLTTLDAEVKTGLATCTNRDLVTGHSAFGYFAERYGFTQEPISGLSPDLEPRASDLAHVVEFVREHDVRTIYAETIASPLITQALARETGARVAVLDTVEGISDESAAADYPGVMRANLATLRLGQDCP